MAHYGDTQALTRKNLPIDLIIDLTDDEKLTPPQIPEIDSGSTIDELLQSINASILDRLEEAYTNADEIIDGYVRGLKEYPNISGSKTLRLIWCDLVAYGLYDRRPGEKPKSIVEGQKQSIQRLMHVQSGLLLLDVPAVGEATKATVNKTSDDEMFSDDLLSRMP